MKKIIVTVALLAISFTPVYIFAAITSVPWIRDTTNNKAYYPVLTDKIALGTTTVLERVSLLGAVNINNVASSSETSHTSFNIDVQKDTLNTLTSGLYIYPRDLAGRRIFFGASGRTALLNFSNVTGIESVPTFLTQDTYQIGFSAGGSDMIGRTGNNVVLRTSGPGSNLLIQGGSAFSSSTEYLRVTTDGKFGFGTSTPIANYDFTGIASSTLTQIFNVASSSGTSYFNVASTGNVGVGTSTASKLFTIGNTGVFTVDSGGTVVAANAITSSNNGIVSAGNSSVTIFGRSLTVSSNQWQVSTPQGAGFTSPSTFFSGSMLVGSSTAALSVPQPGARLAVQGDFGSTTPLFDVATTTSSLFATTSMFRILHNGNVGIASSTPQSTFSVSSSSLTTFFAVNMSPLITDPLLAVASSTGTSSLAVYPGGAVYAPNTTSSGSSQTGYWCYDTNGQLIRDSAVCIVSAKKFKTRISPLTLGLKDLLKLTPVTYYKKEPLDTNDSHKQMGFIADDVAQVSPELNEMLVTRDSQGEIHGFRYDEFTALLTKSIQELNQKVEPYQRKAEENIQNFIIALLIIGMVYQQSQILKLKK